MQKFRPNFKIILTIVFTFIFFNANAQCDPFFDPFCEDVDVYVPLDDNLLVLMTATTLFGAWFIAKRKLAQKSSAAN